MTEVGNNVICLFDNCVLINISGSTLCRIVNKAFIGSIIIPKHVLYSNTFWYQYPSHLCYLQNIINPCFIVELMQATLNWPSYSEIFLWGLIFVFWSIFNFCGSKFRFSIIIAQTPPMTIIFHELNIHGWLCITKNTKIRPHENILLYSI